MNFEDFELTAEEIAESEKESAEYNERLALGGEADPVFESEKQAFMRGGDVRVEASSIAVKVEPDLLKEETVVARISDERTRYGFSLVVSEITVDVEKVIVKDSGSSTRIISASTRDIGPPKMDVTWEFLSNSAIMVAQYAMPFNRLGSMLTVPNKRFTSAKLSRMFCYVAKRLEPVYLHNFRSLANAPLLSGDDTPTKVLEFSRTLKLQQNDLECVSPWARYATASLAETAFNRDSAPSLGILTARELGFEFDRKDGAEQKNHCRRQFYGDEVRRATRAAPPFSIGVISEDSGISYPCASAGEIQI